MDLPTLILNMSQFPNLGVFHVILIPMTDKARGNSDQPGVSLPFHPSIDKKLVRSITLIPFEIF